MNSTSGITDEKVQQVLASLDDVFLLINGIIVCLMQAGFCCLEIGAVRSKNATSIVIKNVLDLFVSGVCYWLVGFPLAWGYGGNLIGSSGWVGIHLGEEGNPRYSLWFFQLIFAATAATIVSGAVAERCKFSAYIVYSAAISGFARVLSLLLPPQSHRNSGSSAFASPSSASKRRINIELPYVATPADIFQNLLGVIYPLASRWVWNPVGWLAARGVRDFAGSCILHALGGMASFIAATILGPRKGRFKESFTTPIAGHSVPMFGLGTLLLVTGFLAFNAGSQGHMTEPGDGATISRAAANTIISGAGGAFVALIAGKLGLVAAAPRKWLASASANGTLAGCVAVCAGANLLPLWAAFLTGAGGSAMFLIVRKVLITIRVDDPLDATPVHLGAGAWGTLVFPLLQQEEDRLALFAENALCLGVIVAWTAVTCGLLFGALHFMGLLREGPEKEEEGLDIAVYGEAAYPETNMADLKGATMETAAATVHAVLHGNTLPVDTRPSSMVFTLHSRENLVSERV